MIRFIIESATEDEVPKGCSISQVEDTVILNMIMLAVRLSELGVRMPEFKTLGWRETSVTFESEHDAMIFKLACNRKILNEDHI